MMNLQMNLRPGYVFTKLINKKRLFVCLFWVFFFFPENSTRERWQAANEGWEKQWKKDRKKESEE